MKICVFSDSHGESYDMLRAIEETVPDMVIHLGDGRRDADEISRLYPDIPLIGLRGNCDFASDFPETELLDFDGLKIFLTHGHLYNVKSGLSALFNAGHFSGASLILYGHTHIARSDSRSPLEAVNPGSCGRGRERSWMLLELSGGSYSYRIIKL